VQSKGVCLIEYTDMRMLEHNYAMMQTSWLPSSACHNEHIERLRCPAHWPTDGDAVARANGMNRINILIPCHRDWKDGQLIGYGGGLWRKRLLLKLERTGKLPGNETTSV